MWRRMGCASEGGSMSLTMHEEPEQVWEVACGEEAGEWRPK